MAKGFRIVRAVVTLLIAAFLVMVVWGIFTALNAAPSFTLSQSDAASTDRNASVPNSLAFAAEGDSEYERDTGVSDIIEQEAGNSNSVAAGEAPSTTYSPDSAVPNNSSSGGQGSPPATSSSGNGSPAPNGSGSSSGSSGSSGSPAPSTPPRTFHPAWDEWVEEGHWVTEEVPATYAQREVYGSICNECGLTVSGFAMQHLKDTHHSGYHEGVTGYETYEATPARSVQVWVDTSHWVTHPEYWD